MKLRQKQAKLAPRVGLSTRAFGHSKAIFGRPGMPWVSYRGMFRGGPKPNQAAARLRGFPSSGFATPGGR